MPASGSSFEDQEGDYSLTGPEALTVSDAAAVIADVTGRSLKHDNIDREREVWIQGAVACGVPAEYGETLRMLTERVALGTGSRPNDNVERSPGLRQSDSPTSPGEPRKRGHRQGPS